MKKGSTTKLEGVVCPSVTPLTKNDKVDFKGLEAHFKRLTDAKINGILLNGTIGEFANLTVDERIEMIKEAKKFTSLPLIAHVTSTVMSDMLKLAETAYSAGYDSVMILPPYYYGQTRDQLISYYEYLDANLGGNWYIYNFPARTNCDIDYTIVKHLIEHCPKFIGIKDTVDCASHTRLITLETQKLKKEFSVFAGFDEYFVPNLMNGGAGVLAGLTNIIPEVFASLYQAYQKGDLTKVASLHKKICELSQIYLIGDDFVSSIKTVVSRKFGYMLPHSRNFNGKLTASQLKLVDSIFEIK